MSTPSATPDVSSLEAEHRIQLSLFDAIQEGLRRGRAASGIEGLLDQLIDYSNVHFLSEQLMMRMYEYPEIEAHTQEHDRLIEQVRELRERAAEDPEFLAQHAERLRAWLWSHIQTQDFAFGRYLRELGVGADAQPRDS